MSTVQKVPMRKCVGCGEMKNKKELIRVRKKRSFWMLPEGRTEGAHICAEIRNACFGRSVTKGWKDPWE